MAEPDPRLREQIRTLNEELLRGTIRHAIYIQRLKAHLAARTVGFLNRKVFPDLISKVVAELERIEARGAASGVWRTRKFIDLTRAMAEILSGGMKGAEEQLAKLLKSAAKVETAFAVKQIVSSSPVDLSMGLPTAKTVDAIVTAQPFQGAVLKDWFEDLSQRAQRRLQQQVTIGLIEGESIPDLVKRIRGTRANNFTDGVLQTSRREAEMIARTAAEHVSARSRETVYEENSDIVKGVMWVATLDGGTCPRCAALDGEVFKVGEGPRPPLHWGCRCGHTPVLRTWRDLGIDIDEAPEGTRASMDGQVPATMSFPEWLEEQPASMQDEVLGPVRARLWREGELEFKDFVDERGRLLTLEELARLEGVEIPAIYSN